MNHPTDHTGAPITSYLRAELERFASLKAGPFTEAQIAAELARRDGIHAHLNRNPELRHS